MLIKSACFYSAVYGQFVCCSISVHYLIAVWLSVPAQLLIGWKDSSPKWPIMCLLGRTTILTPLPPPPSVALHDIIVTPLCHTAGQPIEQDSSSFGSIPTVTPASASVHRNANLRHIGGFNSIHRLMLPSTMVLCLVTRCNSHPAIHPNADGRMHNHTRTQKTKKTVRPNYL